MIVMSAEDFTYQVTIPVQPLGSTSVRTYVRNPHGLGDLPRPELQGGRESALVIEHSTYVLDRKRNYLGGGCAPAETFCYGLVSNSSRSLRSLARFRGDISSKIALSEL